MNIQSHIENFNNRPRYERVVIMGLGSLSALLFLSFAVIKPLSNYYVKAEQNLNAAIREASVVDAALLEVETLQGGVTIEAIASVDAFERLIKASAIDAGLSQLDIEVRDNETLKLEIEGQAPFAIFNWLGRLEREYGISVAQATIAANGKPGLVSAQLFLKRLK